MDHKKSSIENKLFTFILIFTILTLIIAPFASAVAVNMAENHPTGTYENTLKLIAEHPSLTSSISAIGQSFTVATEGYLQSISVELQKEGSPTGHIGMILCNATLTDTHFYPNETTILATSTSVFDVATDLTHAGGGFTFAFDDDILLPVGGNYSYYLYYTDSGTRNTDNYVRALMSTTNTYEGSYDYTAFRFFSNAWAYTTGDMYFTVIGLDAAPTPTPTPDPSATATPTAAPTTNPQFTQIWNTLASLINLLVPLLCVVLPAFFGYKFAGAWGFMAGVNIGAILAYTILGSAVFPLWGIVALLIIDALLLFGKVGLHE